MLSEAEIAVLEGRLIVNDGYARLDSPHQKKADELREQSSSSLSEERRDLGVTYLCLRCYKKQ